MPITIDGRTFAVPGVYGTVEVIQRGSVSLPVFNGLLIVGTAKQGIGYDAGKGGEVIKSFSNIAEAEAFFGYSSPIISAMAEAKKGGAGVVHALCVNPLTRASANITDGTNPLFTLKPKTYGAPGADNKISITVVSNNVTVQITRAFSIFCAANVLVSDTVLTLESVEGLNVGDSVYLLDNTDTTEGTAKTITLIDAVNKKITVASTFSNACATADYARVVRLETGSQLTRVFDKTSATFLNDLVAYIQSSGLFEVSSISTTAVPSNITSQGGLLGLITGATKGTSPSGTLAATGLTGKIQQLLEEWTNTTKARIRIVNLVRNGEALSGTVNAWKPVATTLRQAGSSIQIVIGADSGAIANNVSDSNSPAYIAKYSINSQDFIFAGMGYDGKSADLSLAPFVAGMLSGNSVKKNLTYDPVPASVVEKTFGQYNQVEAEANIKSGVLILTTGKNGFFIAQGINTYQNQGTVWNQNDDATYLIRERQIADFVFEGYKEQMEQSVGVDSVSVKSVAAYGFDILSKYAQDSFITDYKIADAYRQGNAIYTVPQIMIDPTTDFIGFTLKVITK